MTNPIFKGIMSGFIILSIVVVGDGFYTGRLTWGSTSKPIILQAECTEPKITSIQFNTEVLKFLMLDDRLNLLMPLPITGLSATIVDIRSTMKKMRK